METELIKKEIESGCCSLGIELGSTRIKAILIASDKTVIAGGAHDWENRNENGIWTYTISDIKEGLAHCYQTLKSDVKDKYGIKLTNLKALGISAMMHGYMAFDKEFNLLTSFRTWRNTITAKEAEELTSLFNYPIPQRWSISHFLRELKNNESYLFNLDYICTLSSYVHYLLTGEKVLGIGDASGMFPIDVANKCYDEKDIELFDDTYLEGEYPYSLKDLLPRILLAGEKAGTLTKAGALLLDKDGDLLPGVPLCPPEGDAGTGMVATNAVLPRSGNVSAGTSAFAMVVLEKPLSASYKELDLVTTPDGYLVAMAHTNNCTGSYDAWFNLFKQVIEAMGVEVKKGQFYDTLLNLALTSDPDCGGLLSYNYIAGEPIVGLEEGKPLFVRDNHAKFDLANFIRSELYTAVAAMRVGLDILYEKEKVQIDVMNGHGGYFKTAKVGQEMMASALKTPIKVLSTAGEGGAWGIALLADYLSYSNKSLSSYLEDEVFVGSNSVTVTPTKENIEGFNKYYERYLKGLAIEKAANESFVC